MNENLNLVKILNDCPKGTKLYSMVFGEVKFMGIKENAPYPIIVKVNDENFESFTTDGRVLALFDGECTLFPSKDQRDWSKFKPKFNPNTLQPFDKVLTRYSKSGNWLVQLFSHTIEGELNYPYLCINNSYKYCIPYNDDTKHLVGTTEEAPEYYRYWED